MSSPFTNFLHVFYVLAVLIILVAVALYKIPRYNSLYSIDYQYKLLDQIKNKEIMILAIFVFSYHLFKFFKKMLIVNPTTNEGLEMCPPPALPEEMTIEQGVSDVALTGSNIHHIRMFDSDPGYSQPSLKIKIGDVVVWTNVGGHVHSVTSTKRSEWLAHEKMEPSYEFNSGLMKPGQTYAVKFTQKGWFPYYCLEHKGWMQGELHVE
jgi:plastocyanin